MQLLQYDKCCNASKYTYSIILHDCNILILGKFSLIKVLAAYIWEKLEKLKIWSQRTSKKKKKEKRLEDINKWSD